ncbi:MAG: LLM class flavin-dependent oxidoreductase, partial [Acidimicrobiales bacterium]
MSAARPQSEFSWFGALCDDDYEQLGVPRADLRSSWQHCRDIVTVAEESGFDNILLPSGYELGIDTVSFASSIAPFTSGMRLLVAVRCGEVWPPQLGRQLATLNQTLGGRLTVNIISSEMPGESLDGPARYARTLEVMTIVRSVMKGERVDHDGEWYSVHVDPPRITRENPVDPQFYFGGLSDEAREVAAAGADVYLMWPDTEEGIARIMDDVRARAARHGRSVRFGYRCHVVVR